MTVHTGAADIGQGSTTAVAQVVAEVLALPIEMVHVRSHESDTSPVDLGSYSSRVTFMNANAAIRAAIGIRDQLLKAAWDMLGYHPNVLVLNDRRIYYKHDPAIGVSYLEALHKAQADTGALIARGAYRSPPMGGVHKVQQLALLLLIPSRLTLQKLMLTLKPDWFLAPMFGPPTIVEKRSTRWR